MGIALHVKVIDDKIVPNCSLESSEMNSGDMKYIVTAAINRIATILILLSNKSLIVNVNINNNIDVV